MTENIKSRHDGRMQKVVDGDGGVKRKKDKKIIKIIIKIISIGGVGEGVRLDGEKAQQGNLNLASLADTALRSVEEKARGRKAGMNERTNE